MTPAQLAEITQLLLERIEKAGGKINSVNYCIHLESEKCACRKPKTGLFLRAVAGRNIDFRKTWMVGDSWRDIEAGQAIGSRTIWIGDTQYISRNKKRPSFPKWGQTVIHEDHQITPDYCVKDLAQAVDLIARTDASQKTAHRKK